MKVKRMKETMLGGTMWLQLITRQNMLKNHLKNSWFIKKKRGKKGLWVMENVRFSSYLDDVVAKLFFLFFFWER